MNELMIFNNPEFGEIRTVEIDGEPWLVGKDVAKALGYADTKSALSDHVDAEDKQVIQRGQIATFDIPNRGMTIINESGVYSLVFSSKLPGAKKFKRWVTSEVLPAIRKQGGYLSPQNEAKLEKLLEGFQALTDRVAALEGFNRMPPQLVAPKESEKQEPQVPGKAALKRWMRTVSEKLDLMSNKFNMSNNAILHQVYGFLETDFGVDLTEERLRIMEERGLEECSTLKAIFYEEDFRDDFQRIIDHNLSPENRGW